MIQTNFKVQDGNVVVTRTQQCTPIADRTKAMHNEGLTGSNDMRLAASIPNVMIEKYCIDNKITFQEWSANPEHIRRVLNDPALAHFRVWKGRV